MSHNNLVILTKILFYYSIFVILVRTWTLFQAERMMPHFLLLIPFVLLVIMLGWQVLREKYHWMMALFALMIVVLVRIFERDLFQWLAIQLN